MKEFWKSLDKYYFTNFSLIFGVIFSIITMFVIQFKVENLQDEMQKTKNQISDYEDKIRLLEVEWVYLTRPERLRQLASRYLKNNGYALANQIKEVGEIGNFGDAIYKKDDLEDVTKSKSL